MTYLHKLAQRLARIRSTLAVILLVAACEVPLAPGDGVTRLLMSPKSVVLLPNQTANLMVVGFTAAGDTSTGMSLSWSATGGTLTDSSANGGKHYGKYKSGSQPGSYKVVVKATPGTVSDTATVTVNAVPVAIVALSPTAATLSTGQTAQLTATPEDSTGATLTGRAISWASSNSGVTTVSGTGLVTAVASGSASITATSESKSASASITVSNVPVASVSVTPVTTSIVTGQSVQLTATPRDANGNALSGRVVTWSSSDPTVATVNGSGRATGVAAGAVTITATSESKSGSATVTVTLAPVATVSVAPASATVNAGQTVQLTATPKDASGNPLTGRTITWVSSNTAAATVSGTGLVTGVAAGTATIIATAEGQSGTAAVTVRVPVASVSVTPATASVNTGQTVQLTATPRDASGNALSGRTITWASGSTAVAMVNGSGLVTGVAAGATTITATSEGQSGGSAITVTLAPIASVTVAPATAGLQVGQTLQLSATPRDSSGNPLTGRTITWSSSNPSFATVSGSGLVSGVAVGVDTVTATSGGQSGRSIVTVAQASSVWANEPAGLGGIATNAGARDYDWVTQDVTGASPTASGWFNPYASDYGKGQLALVNDPTAPSPNSVVQVMYPIGWNVGSAPGEVDYSFPSVTEYYIGFYVKISNPYLAVGGGHNKLAYLYTGNKDLVFEFTPHSNTANGTVYSGPWNFFFAEYVSHNGAEFDTYGSVPLQSGVWYKVEILMSYSQGVVKWWVNGVLDGTIPCNFVANAGGPLHQIQFSPTYGGGGAPAKTEVDYIWYDHVHMSGSP